MIDRTNLDDVAGFKLKSMFEWIEQQKAEGKSGENYPWYVPNNPIKRLDGFKALIFQALNKEGNHLTDFLPGFQPEMGGVMRSIYICWTPEAKAEAESKGLEFKVY